MKCFLLMLTLVFSQRGFCDPVHIGSKKFTEGYLLSELAAQKLEAAGIEVKRSFGLGGTGFLFEAIRSNEVQMYPEYTGTIAQTILLEPELHSWSAIRDHLNARGLTISEPLGFKNNYALAVPRAYAEREHVHSISDVMKLHPRAAFSHEFMVRADGYPALQKKYSGSIAQLKPLEHSLAYQAVAFGAADIIDVYTTDAMVKRLDLVLLDDDKQAFPTDYEVVWLARRDFVERDPKAWAILKAVEGTLNESTMRDLNSQVEIEHKSFGDVIGTYLHSNAKPRDGEFWSEIRLRTKEHIGLVAVSLVLACLLGIPLGIWAAYNKTTGQVILLVSGLFQTIPSLALLCFLIPVLGIGTKSALVALFLYSLLPVVLGTYTGIRGIEGSLIEVARALGLTVFQRLRMVELPQALPSIVAGVRASAIIGIGTATLAALIGAGGYGVPILTGLAINDIPTILTGAVPSAVLALIVNFVFSRLAVFAIPHGVRK